MREAVIEVGDECALDTAALKRSEFVSQVRHTCRRSLGRKELARMGLESHHGRHQFVRVRSGSDARQQRLMAAVNAVEIANRQRARHTI